VTRRAALAGTFAFLVLVSAAIFLATLRPKDDSDLAGRERFDDPLASLPAIAATDDEAASRAAGASGIASTAPAGALRDGRVVVADGGEVPRGTRAVLRRDNPDAFAAMTFEELAASGFAASPSGVRRLLREATARREVLARADVAPDGRFRVAAPDTGAFYAEIESDSLYADGYPRHDGGAAIPIRIRARRGVALPGRVRTLDGEPAAGARVLYQSAAPQSSGMRPRLPREAEARAGADGSFVLRGVPPRQPGVVAAWLGGHGPAQVDLLAGWDASAALDLVLTPAARIVGRVADASGAPVAGAEVTWLTPSFRALMLEARRVEPVATRADGRFEIGDLAPGRVRVRVEKAGLRPAQTGDIELRPAAVVDAGTIALAGGVRISGQVLTPDGKPAAGAAISLVFSLQSFGQLESGEGGAAVGDRGSAVADSDGRFAFDGVGKGPYDLEASLAGYASARKRRHVDDGKPLVLKLRRPGAIQGEVHAAAPSSQAIAEFEVALEQSRTIGPGVAFADPVARARFTAADGRFRMEDLAPGTYSLVVSAHGFARARQPEVKVPAGGAVEVSLEMTPGVSVAGRVLDGGSRRPLAGADVSISASMADIFRTDLPATTSDDAGRFALDGLDPGAIAITARYPDRAPTTAALGELAPGAHVEDFEIALGAGGAIAGVAFDDDGEPMGGGGANAASAGSDEFRQTTLDASGRFHFDHLRPGNYQISVLRGAFIADAGGGSATDMFRGMRFAMATVREGETTQVHLGEEGGRQVHVLGRVLAGTSPIASAMVTAFPGEGAGREERSAGPRTRFATTDPDGRFSVALPPGRAVLQVQSFGASQFGAERSFTIPDVETHEIVITLPLGRIEGTVRGSKQEPLPGTFVYLASEHRDATSVFGTFGQTRVDDAGRYRFENVGAGAYLVSAGGVSPFHDEGPPYGRVSQRVDVADGQALAGIDFVLRIGGSLSGTVTSAGAPVAGASVFLQSPDGKPVSRFSDVFTNAAGAFRARGVAPGEYRALLRAPGFGMKIVEPVSVDAERETTLTIELAPGAAVTARVVDPDSAPLPQATVELFDEGGRPLSGFAGFAEFGEIVAQGAPAPGVVRLGTLAPGRYRVRASAPGYVAREIELKIEGADPRALEIRLDSH